MRQNKMAGILLISSIILSSCASVTTPKEVVELSYSMGENLESVHKGYKELVRERFSGHRRDRLEYLNKWAPSFINTWTAQGRLVDISKGKVVWSKEERGFVQPSSVSSEEQKLKSIETWTLAAVAKIENKKQELMKPLDDDEKVLLNSIDEIFGQLYRANAAVTAHLNSARKVADIENQFLEATKTKSLHEKVYNLIVESSDKAAKGLAEIEKLDQK